MAFETWGNNKFHDPEFCKSCIHDSCRVCSNGPRGREYKVAMAEERIKDAEYEARQWSGIDDF